MGERTLLLGYDLCDSRTQMAVYNRTEREPELIGQTEDNPDAIYETAVELEGRAPIRDFLPRIRRGESIRVDGKKSDPVNVLAYYFRKTLSETRKKYPGETIKQLVVTVPDCQKSYTDRIYAALEKLSIGRDRALVISHRQSFLYYALYQKKELWVNDVGMFEYEGDALNYYQMSLDRHKSPILVGVEHRDLSEALSVSDPGGEHKGQLIENVIQGAIRKQILSVLYMTGDGFEEEWSDAVFKRLCVGRRLFKGRNLYVSGACYAARELGETAKLGDYLLMDEDMVTSHLSISVYGEAKAQDYVLVRAGTIWHQADAQVDVIPDGDGELCLKVTNVFTREEKKKFIELAPVEGKIDRHCRLSVRVRFADVKTCIITIRDKGFGDLFPSSNRIWESTVNID